MKKILITGSGGLIGSEAVEYYCSKGYYVVGTDNNFREYFFGKSGSVQWRINELIKHKNYTHYNSNIVQYEEIKNIFIQEGKFDLIIHTAAQPSHDWACKEPLTDFNVNAVGTINLLEAYRLYSPESVFIFTSTNKVYGDTPNKITMQELETRYTPTLSSNYEYGFNELMSIDHCLHSVFGASKIAADIMVQEYGRYFNLKTVVFRGGCLTGQKHSGVELHGFLSYLVKCCLNDIPYTIFGYKGKQVRDNIHSSDLISAFDCYFESPKSNGEVYNIGGGTYSNCSVLEAINLIESMTGKKLNYTIKDENRIGDHQWWISDTRKFKTHFSYWKQEYNMEKIIETFIK
jgi:CDP-paratose 2-epimerase